MTNQRHVLKFSHIGTIKSLTNPTEAKQFNRYHITWTLPGFQRERERSTMAALNILSQPPSPWQLTTASTLPSICKYNININTICQKYASLSNSMCKCGRTTATAKSKLSTLQMFPQRQHLSGDIRSSFWGWAGV